MFELMERISKEKSDSSVLMNRSVLTGGLITSLVAIQLACIVSFFGGGFMPNMTSRSLRSNVRIDDSLPSHIPSCAKDVYVTLQNNDEKGEENELACTGLLIRDDILITSRECSKVESSTFHFVGVGDLKATPHTSLNEKVGDSSPLGFLKASPPPHFHFVGRPVHRTRMFLSNRSSVTVNDLDTVTAMTCNDHKPIAHDFLVDGQMVPVGQLRKVLPNDILWEDTDLDAPMLTFKSNKWWNRRIKLAAEKYNMKKWIDAYYGPPGSISIPESAHDWAGKATEMCEIMDPRGHRRGCFANYFERWLEEKPFSGMHFFDWLDYGDGKWLLETNAVSQIFETMEFDDECFKKNFNRDKVHYFNEDMRRQWEVYFTPSEDGSQLIGRYKYGDGLVPESDKEDPHLYMWDLDEKFYIVDHTWNLQKYGLVKHSGLMAGRPALSGGNVYFEKNGALSGINYSSGHYRPEVQAAAIMYSWMKNQQYNLTALQWIGRETWSLESCEKAHWDRFKIPGYTASELEQSCQEVMENPTWVLKEDS